MKPLCRDDSRRFEDLITSLTEVTDNLKTTHAHRVMITDVAKHSSTLLLTEVKTTKAAMDEWVARDTQKPALSDVQQVPYFEQVVTLHSQLKNLREAVAGEDVAALIKQIAPEAATCIGVALTMGTRDIADHALQVHLQDRIGQAFSGFFDRVPLAAFMDMDTTTFSGIANVQELSSKLARPLDDGIPRAPLLMSVKDMTTALVVGTPHTLETLASLVGCKKLFMLVDVLDVDDVKAPIGVDNSDVSMSVVDATVYCTLLAEMQTVLELSLYVQDVGCSKDLAKGSTKLKGPTIAPSLRESLLALQASVNKLKVIVDSDEATRVDGIGLRLAVPVGAARRWTVNAQTFAQRVVGFIGRRWASTCMLKHVQLVNDIVPKWSSYVTDESYDAGKAAKLLKDGSKAGVKAVFASSFQFKAECVATLKQLGVLQAIDADQQCAAASAAMDEALGNCRNTLGLYAALNVLLNHAEDRELAEKARANILVLKSMIPKSVRDQLWAIPPTEL